jgi:hypothetical protein
MSPLQLIQCRQHLLPGVLRILYLLSDKLRIKYTKLQFNLLLFLCGFGIFVPHSKRKHRLIVFENKVLIKAFALQSRRNRNYGGNYLIGDLNNICSSENIIKKIKSRRLG